MPSLKPFVIITSCHNLQMAMNSFTKKEVPAKIHLQSLIPIGDKVCLVIWYTPSPKVRTKNIKVFPEKTNSGKKDLDGGPPPQKLSSDDGY